MVDLNQQTNTSNVDVFGCDPFEACILDEEEDDSAFPPMPAFDEISWQGEQKSKLDSIITTRRQTDQDKTNDWVAFSTHEKQEEDGFVAFNKRCSSTRKLISENKNDTNKGRRPTRASIKSKYDAAKNPSACSVMQDNSDPARRRKGFSDRARSKSRRSIQGQTGAMPSVGASHDSDKEKVFSSRRSFRRSKVDQMMMKSIEAAKEDGAASTMDDSSKPDGSTTTRVSLRRRIKRASSTRITPSKDISNLVEDESSNGMLDCSSKKSVAGSISHSRRSRNHQILVNTQPPTESTHNVLSKVLDAAKRQKSCRGSLAGSSNGSNSRCSGSATSEPTNTSRARSLSPSRAVASRALVSESITIDFERGILRANGLEYAIQSPRPTIGERPALQRALSSGSVVGATPNAGKRGQLKRTKSVCAKSKSTQCDDTAQVSKPPAHKTTKSSTGNSTKSRRSSRDKDVIFKSSSSQTTRKSLPSSSSKQQDTSDNIKSRRTRRSSRDKDFVFDRFVQRDGEEEESDEEQCPQYITPHYFDSVKRASQGQNALPFKANDSITMGDDDDIDLSISDLHFADSVVLTDTDIDEPSMSELTCTSSSTNSTTTEADLQRFRRLCVHKSTRGALDLNGFRLGPDSQNELDDSHTSNLSQSATDYIDHVCENLKKKRSSTAEAMPGKSKMEHVMEIRKSWKAASKEAEEAKSAAPKFELAMGA